MLKLVGRLMLIIICIKQKLHVDTSLASVSVDELFILRVMYSINMRSVIIDQCCGSDISTPNFTRSNMVDTAFTKIHLINILNRLYCLRWKYNLKIANSKSLLLLEG